MSIVYTGGTFDCFHAGHVDLLRFCYLRARLRSAPTVVVALNTDDFVEQFKGHTPVCSFDERKVVLESCRYVSRVIENVGGPDSKPAIESVRPNAIVIGDDWRTRDYYAQMQFTPQWLTDRGIDLIYAPRERPLSSTAIKARVLS